MKLKYIKVSDVAVKAKAAIHKTGKLGFSSNAINYFGIDESKYIKFAFDDEETKDNIMYSVITSECDNDSFSILRAGNYYYVNTKGLFDSLGYDYKNNKIIFDLVKVDYEGNQVIKMIKRIISNKKKEVTI